jgi:hypothetical protein
VRYRALDGFVVGVIVAALTVWACRSGAFGQETTPSSTPIPTYHEDTTTTTLPLPPVSYHADPWPTIVTDDAALPDELPTSR